MPTPIQLNRVMRRYWRFAAVVAALLGVVAVIATAQAASMSMSDHDHTAGHGKNAVAMCVALGGCLLIVATAAVAVRRLVQRCVWSLAVSATPVVAWVPEPGRFLARAGPPPLLQVFRL